MRRPLCLSLIPLRGYAENRYESFPNIAAAIQRFVSTARASSAFVNEKEQIAAWLEKEEKKTTQTRVKIASELAEQDRRADYELFGKLIMAHLHELRKGLKTVMLEDTLSLNAHPSGITIPLDPSLSPVANAEKYFEKAKKAKGAFAESLERVKNLDGRLSTLRMLIGELADISSGEALREFHRSYTTHLQLLGYATAKEKENLPPFRIFTVEGGFQVLAGKSSENNDMLTTKYAKPDDLWFHCRGSSGSHVVLKVHSAHGEPSKAAIHQAASIAAYYSKMKNASSVPVAMTEKKFVRKPKGAPAGTVVLEREKVLFVEPKLPFPL
jgi:predicted ribosome quality control (RQC) complex YloA/Tae2 family protein